jgi:putative ABC transport system substrate-binding protein
LPFGVVNRRAALMVMAALAAGAARGQAARPPHIVFVSNRGKPDAAPYVDGFVAGMRELGYVQGREYTLRVLYADNEQARIGPAVREAVATRPAILIVTGLYAARQARDATRTVPVIVATGSDLVDSGVVRSYARPGGNITGVADLTDEAAAKRLELLKAALPKATRVGVVVNPEFPAAPKIERSLRTVAQGLGVELVTARANDRSSLLAAIDSLARGRVDAIHFAGDNNATAHAVEGIAHATAQRVPVAHYWPGTAEAGALFSYQTDVFGNFQRAAWYADRILKGAKPGDLPIELPRRYELIVNRKAATALGIALDNAFVLRADRIID